MPPLSKTVDYLQYDDQHRVLICTKCSYAIQKSAIDSHLLRHKIYRAARHELVRAASQLDILEPEDVSLPTPGSGPIVGLSIIDGYKCASPRCGSLFASVKRMRRHWTEDHNNVQVPQEFALSVQLQTFFRGTKLKYFQVDSLSMMNPKEQDSPSGSASRPKLPNDVNLDHINDFHHYNIHTSNSMPAVSWVKDLPAQALYTPILMNGMLAIAVAHKILIESDLGLNTELELFRYYSYYVTIQNRQDDDTDATRMQTMKKLRALCMLCSWSVDTITVPSTKRMVMPTVDVLSIITCMEDMIGEPTISNAKAGHLFPLTAILETVTSIEDPVYATLSVRNVDCNFADSHPIGFSTSTLNKVSSREDIPPAIARSIGSLPMRMREVFGKPSEIKDVLASLSAINALEECIALYFTCQGEDHHVAWQALLSWIGRMSMHFRNLLAKNNPAALVIFTHWLLLVRLAEKHYWFLKGLASSLLAAVEEHLGALSPAHQLIESVITLIIT
ncbi:hypothetical protein EJ05DRAFT_301612 [Pseudovirgaria hyperparasitica]|uniref:C2H2-type domain-containing protein n=1 Tax=Pseudovirgaria hyperparasitica TaxID=470096 RepID=A0A6A6WAD6_9PEZI|nr:uncharacterized protein EJ05DRAFT_301612 [Pseudovirgaria hyperparasitica]KAF2759535.1 hypothetical protein EJ05DRAFT_301612 [Pseudovirgaria hyperparasitica]